MNKALVWLVGSDLMGPCDISFNVTDAEKFIKGVISAGGIFTGPRSVIFVPLTSIKIIRAEGISDE